MSRRASLPGADELFRKTTTSERAPAPTRPAPSQQEPKSTNLQVAKSTTAERKPKHEEKVTFYCTPEDLMGLERARLVLRSEHGVGVDRGKIVRAALSYVLEDFEARADDSILLRKLRDEE